MNKVLLILLMAAAMSTGCKKSQPVSASGSQDPLEQQLRQLAGKDATNCGRTAPNTDVKNASDCAVQANQAKRPFFVAYEMPGGEDGQVTVALAGAADGKMYAVEYNTKGWADTAGAKPTGDKRVLSSPCPAPLRVAQSGRVTCYPPPAMGGQGNPHGGMMMPPHGGAMPPHGGMSMPPPGTPNPHGSTGVTPKLKGSSSN